MKNTLRFFVLLISITLTACGAEQATSTPETLPTQTPEITQTSEVLTATNTGSPIIGGTGESGGDPPPTPTAIGTMSAETGGIDSLATIFLSATGTLEAKLNPDLGINGSNPIKLNLSQTPIYIFNLGSNSTYSFRAIAYTANGYQIIVDNENKPGRGKVAFGGAGNYTVAIQYEATETATGQTFAGTLTVPFSVSGSVNAPSSGGGGQGGDDGNGGGDNGGGGEIPCEDTPEGCSGTN
jgi:hypothetical protein